MHVLNKIFGNAGATQNDWFGVFHSGPYVLMFAAGAADGEPVRVVLGEERKHHVGTLDHRREVLVGHSYVGFVVSGVAERALPSISRRD